MYKLKVFRSHSNLLLNYLILRAKKEIILSRHSIPSDNFYQALITAKTKGVKVFILLSSSEYFKVNSTSDLSNYYNISPEIILYSKLMATKREEYATKLIQHGIELRYINHKKFFLNHSMYMVIDSKLCYLGSAPNDTTDRLDIGLISDSGSYLKVLKSLFYADFNDKEFAINRSDTKTIAIAPYNMRQLIENLLTSAKSSICMMFPVVTDDPRIINILKQKITERIKILILCSPELVSTDKENRFNYILIQNLINMGISVQEIYNPKIHCRCIITDIETPNLTKVYIGSGNLKTHSLEYSREVGFISTNNRLLSKITKLFQELWNGDY